MEAECIQCGELYPQARKELGYNTCLQCGSPAPTRCVVPGHKQGYMLVTNHDELIGMNVKGGNIRH